MEYECRTIPLSRAVIGPNGVVDPLCNSCKSSDCDNNIEFHKVSIIGITRKWRVMARGNDMTIVIDCEGFC